MKNVTAWLKAHWPIPVLTLIALAVLPTSWYFANQMHEKNLAEYQNAVKKDYDSVADTAAKVSYYLPAVDGTGKVLEKTDFANEARIKAYGDLWTEIQTKVGGVSERGLKFNQGEHKLIIDKLFPPPDDKITTDNLAKDFVARDIAFHRDLLARTKAGEPAKGEDIAKQLNEYASAQRARVQAERGGEMSAEETAKLTAELTAMRLSALRKHAGEIQYYADMTSFEGLWTSVPEQAPTVAKCWDMQERSWIDQDICQAVATANNGSSGVPDSVVKRLTRIAIKPPAFDPGTAGSGPQPAPFEAGEDKPPLDFSVSLTGRVSGPGHKNKWYDVRTVTVDVIVASQKLPQFLNALAATNFITVLDMNLSKIDPVDDLKQGFDYGDDHVVKATLTLETVWLREWRKASMPKDVQAALGMVEGVEGAAGAATQSAPPPPPRGNPRVNPAGGRPAAPGGAGPGGGGGRIRGGGGADRDG